VTAGSTIWSTVLRVVKLVLLFFVTVVIVVAAGDVGEIELALIFVFCWAVVYGPRLLARRRAQRSGQ
jgi:hypothetical protein